MEALRLVRDVKGRLPEDVLRDGGLAGGKR
jgi:hypothetical protein